MIVYRPLASPTDSKKYPVYLSQCAGRLKAFHDFYLTFIMPRTVSDATRFTATSPHAYSKPNENLRSAASNTFSPSNNSRTYPSAYNAHSSPSGPIQFSGSTETPAQKVVRLRAAHAAEKNAEITTWDKIVVKGRVWADVAHRVTVWGLIGATGML